MSTVDLAGARWRKSSRSDDGGGTGGTDCVEVAFVGAGTAVRDSKRPAGPALVFDPRAWSAFLTDLKADPGYRPYDRAARARPPHRRGSVRS
jgi:Domain of unknown function (DUF397)